LIEIGYKAKPKQNKQNQIKRRRIISFASKAC